MIHLILQVHDGVTTGSFKYGQRMKPDIWKELHLLWTSYVRRAGSQGNGCFSKLLK
jgi:hypothetical protein